MSSLRNAVKRVTHKERSQPRQRQHLGILEKKSDYKQRAVDYHRKQDRINNLRTKASQRNPDEFYFGMHNTAVQDGKHQKTEAARQAEFDATIGMDTIRLLKDQDLRYIRLQKQKDIRKAERLQASMHLLDSSSDATKQRKHTVFVESAEEAKTFNAAQHFDTLPELMDRPFNRPRLADLEQQFKIGVDGKNDDDDDDDDNEADEDGDQEEVKTTAASMTQRQLKVEEKQARKRARRLAKAREQGYREIQERQARVEKLGKAEAHLQTEKLVASKGRKRKIKAAEGGQPAVYKWRRKRLN